MWKYQQIKGRALVWWKLKLSVVDEPMEMEESETLPKRVKKKKEKEKYQIFLEVRSFWTTHHQKERNSEIVKLD